MISLSNVVASAPLAACALARPSRDLLVRPYQIGALFIRALLDRGSTDSTAKWVAAVKASKKHAAVFARAALRTSLAAGGFFLFRRYGPLLQSRVPFSLNRFSSLPILPLSLPAFGIYFGMQHFHEGVAATLQIRDVQQVIKGVLLAFSGFAVLEHHDRIQHWSWCGFLEPAIQGLTSKKPLS